MMLEKLIEHGIGPVTYGITILIAIYLIPRSFHALIERVTKFKVPWVEAEMTASAARQIDPPKQQEALATTAVPEKSSIGAPHIQPASLPLIESWERPDSTFLQTNYPGDLNTQIKWAVRSNTLLRLELTHESTYRLIFGSQIHLLKILNLMGERLIDAGQEIYMQAANAFPPVYVEFSYEKWRQFLVNAGYVEVQATGRLAITELGRSFLQWMTVQRVSEIKPG